MALAFIYGNYLTGRIDEFDIAINYYYPWKKHGQSGTNKYCLRDTLTHEFGHAAGLIDVLYRPTETSGIGNCPHWERYTMHGRSQGHDTHGRESLECEDKWALWKKYGHYQDPDD